MKKINSTRNKKRTLAIACGLLVICLAIAAPLTYKHLNHSKPTAIKTDPKPVVNNNPATPAEKKDSEDAKDKIVEQERAQSNSSSGTVSVTPVITHSAVNNATVEVDAYVSGIVEDNGTCTLVATNGTASITKTNSAAANATTTTCQNFIIDKSQFTSKGTWKIVVSYQSSVAQGKSQENTLTIP